MSRTMGSPELKRRPVHDVSKKFHEATPRNNHNKLPNEDLNAEPADETSDMLNVDDGGNHVEQGTGLYPNLTEFERVNAACVIKRDEHGRIVASEYIKTSIKGNYTVPTDSGNFLRKIVLCFVIFLVFAVVVLCYVSREEKPVKPASPQVTEIVSKLRREYVNQPNLSFRIIKKALENVLALKNVSEPLAPAVLLLMSTKGAKDETESFAEQLAKLIASGNRNYQTIYGAQLQSKDPDKAKMEFDNLIKSAPKYNRQIVVLIRDLDVIPSKVVMMLHAYCDHENAPFKNAVYIMTISTDADLSNCESKHFDEAAETHLTSVWGDLGKDMLSALLSRITVSVAAIYHKTKPALCR